MKGWLLGAIIGVLAGFFVGGVGIAARGNATGVPSWAVMAIFAVFGAIAGNYLGKVILRHKSKTQG
ncbi:hypothetical protein SAMN05216337_100143 [Bradyrhizobium brasilense]|uniref:Uncharacterized protein n=1 Tax=Bradyrhizobium brasilense TaxID=1419277 RepID=A0A1G6I6X3_9BRAD|nr:hypothetical protein [Bradyrhizobium brasilense]SDC02178.1 hypothetical protein SAMN05216337_100143 [Bradyrhizobium brasilense]